MTMRTRVRRAAVTGALACACAVFLSAQVPPPPEGAPSTPALERLLDDDEVKAAASGFQYAEGPVWRPDGYLLFADSPRSRIHRWDSKSGLAILREPSNKATAIAFDRAGRLLATEHETRRISRTEKDGTIVTLVDRFEGKRLNSPNDLLVSSNGAVYFTDPPYGLPRQGDGKELDFQGVYRLDPDGRLTLLVRDLPRPNGIGLSPDEQTLYVTDTESSELWAFPLGADGTTGAGRVLARLKPWKSGVVSVADGMTLDADGRLYVTGPGGVWVFAPNGGRLGVIATPEPPSACAFGGPDRRTLYITARTRLYSLRMKVPGLAR
jgi:gluconolactonase